MLNELGDKVVLVRFCLGWIMNSSAWNIVSFLSFSMFHPVSIHSRPNFIHFPSGFIQFFQQFELSSIYILHDFSIILKRFVGAFDPSEQSLCDQKRGGAKRNCSEAECVGADLSFCSFPQKWKGKELQSEFPNQIIQVQTRKWVTWGNTPWDSHEDYWCISSCIPMLGLVNLPFSMGWMLGLQSLTPKM